MAHYRCRIRTALSVPDAFDFMADVRNFERWDPGVASATQVAGEGPGPGASYDVLLSGPALRFRYDVREYDPPRRFTIVGVKTPFTSTDVVEVSPDGDGSIVTYDARLDMPFPLSLGNAWLQRRFDRIGDAAAAGLARELDGEWLR